MANEELEKEKRELERARQSRHHGPGGGFVSADVKVSNFKGTLGRLLGYLKPDLVMIIIVFIITILSTVFSTYSPKVLAKIMNAIEVGVRNPDVGMDFHLIRRTSVFLIFLYAAYVVFNAVQQIAMIQISQKLVYTMRDEIDKKLSKLPIKYFDSHSRGDILSRVANDVENIAMTLQMSLNQVVTAIVTLVSVLVFMLMMSFSLTAISIVTIILCMLMTQVIAKRAKGYFTEQWASTGDLNGQIEEMYTGHSLVKVFNRQQAAMERFSVDNERLYESSFKATFISGAIQPVMNVINNLNYVAVCVFGGLKAIAGTMGIGDVTAFITYSKQLMQPITQTASLASTIQSTIASAERVFELLDEPEAVADQEPLVELQDPKVIKFENVSFSYKPDTKLIENLNITVRPGDKVAIVGPTGAGKTTLVNLLMRFYEVDGGRITIDGVDIRRVPRENLRSHIGMVLQDVWLFNGTIRENIAYGYNALTGKEATDEEIVAAAKMAYVDHFVKTLAEGYDTVINDDATNISQGQKQLMTIARAFLSDPSILILDEATSSVDTRTEVLIQKAMQKLMEGRTSFVIAHRLSTIRDADVILVMNNGTIIEQGNHQQLLDKKGFYYDLYNSQFIGATTEEEPAQEAPAGFPGGFPGGGPGGPGGAPSGKAPSGKGGPGGKGGPRKGEKPPVGAGTPQ
jgi:ATP-binding cassette subfamily B protein